MAAVAGTDSVPATGAAAPVETRRSLDELALSRPARELMPV